MTPYRGSRRAISATAFAVVSVSCPSTPCTCTSMKPGTTTWPLTSTHAVAGRRAARADLDDAAALDDERAGLEHAIGQDDGAAGQDGGHASTHSGSATQLASLAAAAGSRARAEARP